MISQRYNLQCHPMLLQISPEVPLQVCSHSQHAMHASCPSMAIKLTRSEATTKSKKPKKKKATTKSRMNGDSLRSNGTIAAAEAGQDTEVNDEPEPDTHVGSTYKGEEGPGFARYEEESSELNGISSTTSVPHHVTTEESRPHTNGDPKSESDADGGRSAQDAAEKDDPIDSTSQSRGTSIAEQAGSTTTADAMDGRSDDADPRLDALAREKQALREEVAELRKSIEKIHGEHEDELGELKRHLEETQGEKEHAETQYRTLLGKVNTIKSQLGERLKADAVRI